MPDTDQLHAILFAAASPAHVSQRVSEPFTPESTIELTHVPVYSKHKMCIIKRAIEDGKGAKGEKVCVCSLRCVLLPRFCLYPSIHPSTCMRVYMCIMRVMCVRTNEERILVAQAESLMWNTSLQQLDISHNRVAFSGALIISEA